MLAAVEREYVRSGICRKGLLGGGEAKGMAASAQSIREQNGKCRRLSSHMA